MATRETLRNIDKTIQKGVAQTKKEAAQKRLIKKIQDDIRYFLLDEFKQQMRINSSNYYMILQGLNKKRELKQSVLNSFEVNGVIKHKKEITIFFDDNYLKLLNKAKKEIQAEELSKFYQQPAGTAQEAAADEKIDKINAIIKIILIILLFPLIFIGCLFYGIIKNCK